MSDESPKSSSYGDGSGSIAESPEAQSEAPKKPSIQPANESKIRIKSKAKTASPIPSDLPKSQTRHLKEHKFMNHGKGVNFGSCVPCGLRIRKITCIRTLGPGNIPCATCPCAPAPACCPPSTCYSPPSAYYCIQPPPPPPPPQPRRTIMIYNPTEEFQEKYMREMIRLKCEKGTADEDARVIAHAQQFAIYQKLMAQKIPHDITTLNANQGQRKSTDTDSRRDSRDDASRDSGVSERERRDSRAESEKRKDSRAESEKRRDSRAESEIRRDSRAESEKRRDSRAESEKRRDSRAESEKRRDSRAESEKRRDSRAESEKRRDSRVESEKRRDSKVESEKRRDSRAESEKRRDSRAEIEKRKNSRAESLKRKESRAEENLLAEPGLRSSGLTEELLRQQQVQELDELRRERDQADKIAKYFASIERTKEIEQAERMAKLGSEMEREESAEVEVDEGEEEDEEIPRKVVSVEQPKIPISSSPDPVEKPMLKFKSVSELLSAKAMWKKPLLIRKPSIKAPPPPEISTSVDPPKEEDPDEKKTIVQKTESEQW